MSDITSNYRSEVTDQRWLEPWVPKILALCQGGPILELGSGFGTDARYLCAQGLSVISLDVSTAAFGEQGVHLSQRIPIQADLAAGLPFRDGSLPFVLASLCLHYFSWATTVAACQEIRRVLCPHGLLLARLNSTKDVNYGAGSGEQLGRNYYQVGPQCKRFFDEADVRRLFQDWRVEHLEEKTIDRYDKPKVVWALSAHPPS